MELGNVLLDPMGLLLTPSHHHPPALQMPAKLLRRILLTRIWQNHQRGHFGLLQAAQQLAQLPYLAATGWDAPKIAQVLRNRPVMAMPCMVQLLDVLREQLHLRLVCVCNASCEELAALRCQFPALFAKFHTVFASGKEGAGKPSLRFFQAAMQKSDLCAHRTLYLDAHDWESIIAARSVGMHAWLVPMKNTSPAQLCYTLIRDILLLFNPPAVAWASCLDNLFLTRPSLFHHELSDSPIQHPLPTAFNDISLSPDYSLATPSLTLSRKPTEAYSKQLRSRASSQAGTSLLSLTAPDDRWSTTLASARQFLLKTGANDPNKLIQHASLTSDGIRIYDNFAQFLMADLLDDARFLPMQSSPIGGLICFINKTPANSKLDHEPDIVSSFDGTTARVDDTSDARTFMDIPEDLDTTSIGLSILHKFGKVDLITIHEVLDKMLKCVSMDDGILQVYFDLERPRIDPVALANAIFLFHLGKRGHEVEKSERFVESVLMHRAYEEGTLYYNLGEAFLLSVARLVNKFEEHFTRSGMRGLLQARLQEGAATQRCNIDGDGDHHNALAMVMRMRARALCGLDKDEHTIREVVQAQNKDGSWDGCAYYRYGSNAQSWIGNEGLTTAYAYALLTTL